MIYLAAVLIVIGVSLYVAAPLFERSRRRLASAGSAELAALQHERALAVQGLRELDFDHQMRKLSEIDFAQLKGELEAKALHAMAAIDELQARNASRGAQVRRFKPAETGAALPMVNFCPGCGAPALKAANFCAACGTALSVFQARQRG